LMQITKTILKSIT